MCSYYSSELERERERLIYIYKRRAIMNHNHYLPPLPRFLLLLPLLNRQLTIIIGSLSYPISSHDNNEAAAAAVAVLSRELLLVLLGICCLCWYRYGDSYIRRGGTDDYYNGAEFIIISEIESLPTKGKDNTLYIGPARRRSHRAGGGSVFGDGGGG